jgi:hypothetical protein
MKKWYTAVLVFRSAIEGDTTYKPLTEIQWRVLESPSAEKAFSDACAIGEGENHSYKNDAGHTVVWKFAGLFDLHEILEANLRSGIEVYSQILEKDSASYVIPKQKLSVFWDEANKNRRADELLSNE